MRLSLKSYVITLLAVGISCAAVCSPSYDRRGYLIAPAVVEQSAPATSAAFALVPGHYYAADSSLAYVSEFDATGALVAAWAAPGFTRGFKGIAFDTQGNFHVVAVTATGYNVLIFDPQLNLLRTYQSTDSVASNLSFGKIAVADGQVYVGSVNNLRRFNASEPAGRVIWTGNQIFDVDVLPSGNLLVATAYDIFEITPTGTYVREIAPTLILVDLRAILYRPQSDDLFVNMLGHTGNWDRVMRLDPTTGAIEQSATFLYPDDMTLAANGDLVIGSREQAPRFFSTDLAAGSSFAERRMFIARMPDANILFSAGFE